MAFTAAQQRAASQERARALGPLAERFGLVAEYRALQDAVDAHPAFRDQAEHDALMAFYQGLDEKTARATPKKAEWKAE